MLRLNHKNLDVWKTSIDVVADIYRITDNFPKNEMYGLSSQLRRASVSVSSNLSEGASRKSALERRRFFEIARSSVVEIDTQIEISKKLKYLDNLDIVNFSNKFIQLFKMISALISKT